MTIFLIFLQIFALVFGFFYSIIRVKRLKSITFDVRMGTKCYGCATDIEHDNLDYLTEDLSKYEHINLCVACKREESLDKFIKTGFPDATRINKLKKFLFSKKSDKIVWYFIFAVLTSILVEFVARFMFDIKIFWLLTPICNIVYWTLFCYKSKITYIKE